MISTSVLLPEPVLPIIPIRSPLFIEMFKLFKTLVFFFYIRKINIS